LTGQVFARLSADSMLRAETTDHHELDRIIRYAPRGR